MALFGGDWFCSGTLCSSKETLKWRQSFSLSLRGIVYPSNKVRHHRVFVLGGVLIKRTNTDNKILTQT